MPHRDSGSTEELLKELLWTYGPCGQEDEVRAVCARELEPVVDDMWTDDAGNLIGYIGADGPPEDAGHRHRAAATAGPSRATRVMAHMDELSMLVKRIEPDGTVHLTQLGTMYPGNFGLGPIAMLGDNETVIAVLTLGSEHTTKESPRIWETKPDKGDKALDWHHVYAFTGRTGEELADAGVHAGTRVCVERSKRALVEIGGDYVGCYFLDDRAAVTALLHAAQLLREGGRRPDEDVYLVFTTNEEIGGVGGSYASASLPGTLTLALEVGPTEQEYATTVTGGPIVGYSDAMCDYDKDVADRLMKIATDRGLKPQAAVLGAFMSDASHSKANGLTPRAGLLCLPTLSTHGYEVMRRSAIEAMAAIIVDFVASPDGPN